VLTLTRQRLATIDKLRRKLGLHDGYNHDLKLQLNRMLLADAELFKSDVWKRVCVLLEDTVSNSKNEVFAKALDENAKDEIRMHTAIAEVCLRLLELTRIVNEEGVEALANSKLIAKMESVGAKSSDNILLSGLAGVNRA